MVVYNIQSAVDYDTKLICAINVTQNSTDHYELPNIAERAIRNINTKLKYISADTIYLNQYHYHIWQIKNRWIIPNRTQSKEKIGKLNPIHITKTILNMIVNWMHLNAQKINIWYFLQNMLNHTKAQKNQIK